MLDKYNKSTFNINICNYLNQNISWILINVAIKNYIIIDKSIIYIYILRINIHIVLLKA